MNKIHQATQNITSATKESGDKINKEIQNMVNKDRSGVDKLRDDDAKADIGEQSIPCANEIMKLTDDSLKVQSESNCTEQAAQGTSNGGKIFQNTLDKANKYISGGSSEVKRIGKKLGTFTGTKYSKMKGSMSNIAGQQNK